MRLRYFCVLAVIFTLSLAAHADTYQISFVDVNRIDYSFDLSSSAIPTRYSANDIYYSLTDLRSGNQYTVGFGDYADINVAAVGYDGLTIFDGGAGGPGGALELYWSTLPFFTGPTSAPALNLGMFPFYYYGANVPNINIVITDITASSITPEPSSFALLETGILGVAGLLKRRLT